MDKDRSRRASRRRCLASASGSREGEARGDGDGDSEWSREELPPRKRGAASVWGPLKEASTCERMCAIMLPMRTERARRRAGLRTNFRSFGSDAFGAMMALGWLDWPRILKGTRTNDQMYYRDVSAVDLKLSLR